MKPGSPRRIWSEDSFGDPFDLSQLPLPRPGSGYAVQKLGSDCLLDQASGRFLPVRDPHLQALFAEFDSAFRAAANWVEHHLPPEAEHDLAIVPAAFDPLRQRHILIYGVLCGRP